MKDGNAEGKSGKLVMLKLCKTTWEHYKPNLVSVLREPVTKTFKNVSHEGFWTEVQMSCCCL